MSELEAELRLQMIICGVPEFVEEYRFAAEHVIVGAGIRNRLKSAGLKDWRFDFAWPGIRFAVEVEGGIFTMGRHTRGAGFEEDRIKYGEAMKLGWTVYSCTSGMIKSGSAIDTIEKLIARMPECHGKL